MRVAFRCPIHGHLGLIDGSVQGYVANRQHPEQIVPRGGKLYFEPLARPAPSCTPAADQQSATRRAAAWRLKPMNRRALFGGFLLVLCLTTLWTVRSQRDQLAGLRREQQQLSGSSDSESRWLGIPRRG